jgi:hypothetical protein
MPKNVQFIGITGDKCKTKRPNQPVRGPGNTGKKAPTIPSRINPNPNSSKKISIVCFIVERKYKTFVTFFELKNG